MILKLQQSSPKDILAEKNCQNDLLQKAANSLIVDHLKACGYQYSESVFGPESQSSAQNLSIQDILNVFGVNPDLASDDSIFDRGFLIGCIRLLQNISNKPITHQGCQTQAPNDYSTLDSKLNRIELDYAAKREQQATEVTGDFEVRMRNYQEKCDEEAREKILKDVERFENGLLKQTRDEEQGKYREMLTSMKQQFEVHFEIRTKQFEEECTDKLATLKKKEEAAENTQFEARQRLLELMDRVASHESEVKREAALNSRTTRMQAEAAEHTKDQLSMRETALVGLKEHYERKLRDEIESERVKIATENEDKATMLRNKEFALRDEITLVKQQQLIHERMVEDVKAARVESVKQQEALAQCREDLGALRSDNKTLQATLDNMKDYQVIVQQATHMRRELLELREKYASVEHEANALQADIRERNLKIEMLSRHAMQPSVELLQLRTDFEELKKANEKLEAELRHVGDSNFEISQRRDEYQMKAREAQEQVSELKLLLRQAMGGSLGLGASTNNLPHQTAGDRFRFNPPQGGGNAVLADVERRLRHVTSSETNPLFRMTPMTQQVLAAQTLHYPHNAYQQDFNDYHHSTQPTTIPMPSDVSMYTRQAEFEHNESSHYNPRVPPAQFASSAHTVRFQQTEDGVAIPLSVTHHATSQSSQPDSTTQFNIQTSSENQNDVGVGSHFNRNPGTTSLVSQNARQSATSQCNTSQHKTSQHNISQHMTSQHKGRQQGHRQNIRNEGVTHAHIHDTVSSHTTVNPATSPTHGVLTSTTTQSQSRIISPLRVTSTPTQQQPRQIVQTNATTTSITVNSTDVEPDVSTLELKSNISTHDFNHDSEVLEELHNEDREQHSSTQPIQQLTELQTNQPSQPLQQSNVPPHLSPPSHPFQQPQPQSQPHPFSLPTQQQHPRQPQSRHPHHHHHKVDTSVVTTQPSQPSQPEELSRAAVTSRQTSPRLNSAAPLNQLQPTEGHETTRRETSRVSPQITTPLQHPQDPQGREANLTTSTTITETTSTPKPIVKAPPTVSSVQSTPPTSFAQTTTPSTDWRVKLKQDQERKEQELQNRLQEADRMRHQLQETTLVGQTEDEENEDDEEGSSGFSSPSETTEDIRIADAEKLKQEVALAKKEREAKEAKDRALENKASSGLEMYMQMLQEKKQRAAQLNQQPLGTSTPVSSVQAREPQVSPNSPSHSISGGDYSQSSAKNSGVRSGSTTPVSDEIEDEVQDDGDYSYSEASASADDGVAIF